MDNDRIEEELYPFKEEFLYHIWDGRHYLTNLKTVSGKRLNIIFNGHFNKDKGPDFHNAVLQLDGEYLRGDIEIHLNTYDWVSHKHYLDTNFNNVVLHVVFKHNSTLSYSIKENGELLEILTLETNLDEEISKLMERYGDKPKFRDKSCDFFNGLLPDQMTYILQSLGAERFKSKIKRSEALLMFSDFNQILYQGLLETCGYSKNKINMITLSELIPWSAYQSISNDLETSLKQMLIQSGLINLIQRDKTESSALISWHTFRIRPANNPAFRFCQIFPLLFRCRESGLLKNIINLFEKLPEDATKANQLILKRFSTQFQNITFMGRQVKKPGRNAIRTILFNVIYPVSILYFEKTGDHTMTEKIWQSVIAFGKLGDNYITDLMRSYITEHQYSHLKREILRQGILKIYFDSCEYFACRACKEQKEHLLSEM
ncbi:MAG: DUF2851 family protein [Candidatus Cloacimonetes bacterium]|nr:DUF2851 family protein [Candidatus Cloacimonadota bacterium]